MLSCLDSFLGSLATSITTEAAGIYHGPLEGVTSTKDDV